MVKYKVRAYLDIFTQFILMGLLQNDLRLVHGMTLVFLLYTKGTSLGFLEEVTSKHWLFDGHYEIKCIQLRQSNKD